MLGLEAPWESYRKKVFNLFNVDPEINVDSELTELEDGNFEFMISSKNGDKLYAIERILGSGQSFAGVKVRIKYGYENAREEDWASIWERAFSGNPHFKEIVRYDVPVLGKGAFAVFNRDIISFYDDNLADYQCNSHYIVADMVNDIVMDSNVRPCTFCE